MAMDAHLIAEIFGTTRSCNPFLLLSLLPFPRGFTSHRSTRNPRNPICCRVFASALPGREVVGEDIMHAFFKDRQTNGDFISKIYDKLWTKGNLKFANPKDDALEENIRQIEILDGGDTELNYGFLKLVKTKDWVYGENIASTNKKSNAKEWIDDSEKWKSVSFLEYEALKGELLLLTIAVGAASSLYCLVNLSAEAAISYVIGVLFSCLYLVLLYSHADNLCKGSVPNVFIQKKLKGIGISVDLKNALEKAISGASLALSSPRLVIPATIYGFWVSFSPVH
ncbi:hypothetical protein HPP92_026725 [Vanilla planifolia]|uniref:Uncharacterized protein n=1 Tax=Vanilla planifolia TaxID=51239 RepID=A0A835PE57_VANPL|nr:hypothetical protein HPP92_026725 [Vanilla planifolia]